MPWERSQQHFPGLMAASASGPQILTRGVSSLFLPSPSISSLCVGDSAPVFTQGFSSPCATAPKSVSLTQPFSRGTRCLAYRSYFPRCPQTAQTQQRQNAQSFSSPSSVNKFLRCLYVTGPAVIQSHKTPNGTIPGIFCCDQSYSGLVPPQESTFSLSIPCCLPAAAIV